MRLVSLSRPRSAPPLAAVGVFFLMGLLLGACSMPIADMPLIGLPENTPPRPETPAPYLPVHDIPAAPRQSSVLTPEEQAKIEHELAAARDRQAGKQTSQQTAQ